ncbi:MAG: rhodanese-like domain-containing protein [Firmicutes bacterium]|nr:rhodanese-like domain-containing protein [Bacillota bacterium]
MTHQEMQQFLANTNTGEAILLDLRSAEEYAAAHPEGAYNCPFDNSVEWIQKIQDGMSHFPNAQALGIFADNERIAEAAQTLLSCANIPVSVAFDGGVTAWEKENLPVADPVPMISVEELAKNLDRFTVIDVRERDELEGGTIPGARVMPLSTFQTEAATLDPAATYVLVCAHGNRSVRMIPFLQANGFKALSLIDGLSSWNAAQLPLESVSVDALR